MATQQEALTLLRRALDEPAADFRDGQWPAIDAIVNQRRRLLVVERTGWGKSSVYFIATRLLRDQGWGLTLIVSPLLALMRNQTEAARRLGLRALSINSANRSDWPSFLDAIRDGEVDALLISPERLANDVFVRDVLMPIASNIGLCVVDEAHCISDWGHDFRPDYRRLVDVLRSMPRNMPVLGTTATANDRVVEDICSQLGNIAVQRGSLLRETLHLQTLRLADQAARLAWLATHVPELPGTGIIYALTKRDAEQVAAWLRGRGIAAHAYYSDVESPGYADSNTYQQHLEELLLTNQVKALVATTALGMGYDKPDLGFVVHYQAPSSIIAYYQQVGRAGRAIDAAFGILMSGREDDEIHEYFRSSAFPRDELVGDVLAALEASDGLTKAELESRVNAPAMELQKVLKFLSVERPAPIFLDRSRWVRTPVRYELDREKIERLTDRRAQEWREVQEYLATPACLMHFLGEKLDDPAPAHCGKCSRCVGRPLIAESFPAAVAVEAARFLRSSEFPLECRKQVAPDAFPEYGFKGNLPADLRAEVGRTLAVWGDAGWGKVVADGKHLGRFPDELVQAVAEMVVQRWRPAPRPNWITCVPSLAHPTLVSDFAARLAARLGLTFVPAVTKVRANAPQKEQQNRFHQCRNLDGVFAVAGVRKGPVLLVDDVVDSGWTLTVVAALLRQHGSGPVFPLALASTAGAD